MPKFCNARLRSCLLAAVAGGFTFLAAAQAAQPITAYRDTEGKVVFVNDPSNDFAPPQAVQARISKRATRTSVFPKHVDLQKLRNNVSFPTEQTAEFRMSLNDVIQQTASRHQVDPDLVRAVIRVESNFNPNAVSPKGASGLMQLIPSTARRFGVGDIFDPKANLDGGVRYLRYLMDMFGGDLKLSLAAYNAGENAVGRYNGVPPYQETQDYVRKIAALYPVPSYPVASTITSIAASPTQDAAVIERYADSRGIVHFSNTDMP